MAVANLLKLAILFIGFIGYLTGSQQPEEEIQSVQSVIQNHRDRRSIYLNAKAPILIGNLYRIYKFFSNLRKTMFNLTK